MTPEEWREAKALLQSALELPPKEREDFLARRCGDEAMRREVRSLIASYEKAGDFGETPAATILSDDEDKTAKRILSRVGPYEINALIGSGGMGEVYLATDTRLGRKVALKVLPAQLAGDDDRVLRLAQEARAASALNHPNIVTIHELTQFGSSHYIVQEYVDGETLRARLSRGTLAVPEAMEIAAQVASALSAAHAAGIVHRDIKPENIMIRRDGLVKVLDFGLAKLTSASSIPQVQTAAGLLMGTVLYMSPEQARGETVDARTDVWSLGVVLYEMLAGHRPFDGPTASDTVARILHSEPGRLNVPTDLQRIVAKALSKKRDERYSHAGELLQELRVVSLQKKAVASRSIFIAALAAIAVIAAVAVLLPTRSEQPKTMAAATPQFKSVAVLPFTNLSGDARNDYLSDGMTEEIINALGRIGTLKVVSRTSAFAFKGKSGDIREVAGKLNVTTIVDGSVRKAGNRVRVSAELVSAGDGYQLWSETYDRELTDVFVIQGEIATSVAEALRARLVGQPIVSAAPARSLDAYEVYLKGRQATSHWTRAGLNSAVSYFRLATERDPSFAQAWAGLADAYSLMDHTATAPALEPKEAYRLAEEAANHALALDANSAEAHAALGHIYTHMGSFVEAERHLRRALELNPNSAMAHVWYATYLRSQRRNRESKEHYLRARAVDPYSALVAQMGINLWTFDFDGAADFAARAAELEPEYGERHAVLARVRALQGRFPEAEEELRRAAAAKEPPNTWEQERAIVWSLEGRRQEALALLAKVERGKRNRNPVAMFRAYAASGDRDQAAKYVEAIVRTAPYYGRPNLDLPSNHPAFEAVLSDPRYRKARRDLGLPP